MSTRRPNSKKAAQSPVQPWHIAVIVVALLVGGFMLTRVVGEARVNSSAKVEKPATAPPPPPQASPKTINRIRDKDSDSDN